MMNFRFGHCLILEYQISVVSGVLEHEVSYDLYPHFNLLPTGSEETGVLGAGCIPVAILPSCQCMHENALLVHENEYI